MSYDLFSQPEPRRADYPPVGKVAVLKGGEEPAVEIQEEQAAPVVAEEPILVTPTIRSILNGKAQFDIRIGDAGHHSGTAYWEVGAGHCTLIGRHCRDITRAKARAAHYVNSGRAMARLKYLTTP